MKATTLPSLMQRFFTDKLYNQTEASPHTVSSYRDTFRLLLSFASKETGKAPTKLSIDNLDAKMVAMFLTDIENTRKNSARTRNTRLAAIRSFFRFVATNEPAYMLHCQKILSLPAKRYIKRNIEYLNEQEMQALINAPDCSTWIGRRDHVIILVALQTGLRASEIINLQRCDIVLEKSAYVRCEGKGRKQRATPLRHETVNIIRNWLKEQNLDDYDPLFPTVRGGRMSRDALELLIKRHTKTAALQCPSLIGKRISPHILRHSTAMNLLHHGVDQAVIALWLGHESIDTTQIYFHADMKLKEKALAKMENHQTKPARYKPNDELLDFLENL
ncbi:MAG: site-specific integrase [Bacteroidales bacterium]|nr:site-specific integrase [Bacteroidales bacterium]